MAWKSIKEIQSEDTLAAKNKLDSHVANPVGDYVQSQKVADAYNNYTAAQNSKPGDYVSRYQGAIDSVLDKIRNQKDFHYDFNADPIYQQYKEQYATLGKQAMLDTTAQAAALSGGYGNSYGATAGSQAYQGYLQRLNDIIPDLYGQARDQYNANLEQLYNQFSALGDQEDREHGQYQDKYQNWQQDVSDALNAYNIMHGADMDEYQQKRQNWESDRDYLYGAYTDSLAGDQYINDYNYQESRDAVADDQWRQEFEYQKSRDAVADEQWAKEYALSLARSGGSGSSKRSSTSSGNNSSGSTKTMSKVTSATISPSYYNQIKAKAATGGKDYVDSLYSAGIIDEGLWNSLYSDLALDAPTMSVKKALTQSSTPSLQGLVNFSKR